MSADLSLHCLPMPLGHVYPKVPFLRFRSYVKLTDHVQIFWKSCNTSQDTHMSCRINKYINQSMPSCNISLGILICESTKKILLHFSSDFRNTFPFSGPCYLARCDLITQGACVFVKCIHFAINTAYKNHKKAL